MHAIDMSVSSAFNYHELTLIYQDLLFEGATVEIENNLIENR